MYVCPTESTASSKELQEKIARLTGTEAKYKDS
jgi:hypothetical protein